MTPRHEGAKGERERPSRKTVREVGAWQRFRRQYRVVSSTEEGNGVTIQCIERVQGGRSPTCSRRYILLEDKPTGGGAQPEEHKRKRS